MTYDELDDVKAAHAESGKHLMVGFDRRFAQQVQTLKRLLNTVKALIDVAKTL